MVAFEEEYELLVPGIRLWISLGCSPEERRHPQPVDVDVRMTFSKEPLGCKTDSLKDVVCYQTVAELILESLKNRSFHLIESLASSILDLLVKKMNLHDLLLEVAVSKPNHPVPHIHRGIVFKAKRKLSQKSS